MSTSFFEGMNDAQLEAYFLGGSAVVPSQEPPYNATGKPTWDLCAGEPLINAFTANSSVAKANWPAGLQRALEREEWRQVEGVQCVCVCVCVCVSVCVCV